jgi:hypothetical protein
MCFVFGSGTPGPPSNGIETQLRKKKKKKRKERNKRMAPYKLDSSFLTFSFDYRTASSWAQVFFYFI